MKVSKNLRIAIASIFVFFFTVRAGMYLYSANINKTPYREGSMEYVGYSFAKANGIKNAGECSMDPEFQEPKFLEGCRRYFEK